MNEDGVEAVRRKGRGRGEEKAAAVQGGE